ncbi:MAG: FAD-dependent oxidoreductase [Clostridia bacterium]|nr:FAD-dependent oxidoreductase [Clostridia bacterium]
MQHDIVIVGGGPAGMAAAVAAYDAGVKDVVILDREPQLGGILMQCVHNGFGLHKLGRELTGPEYAYEYAQQVRARGIKVYSDTTVTGITADKLVTATSCCGILKIRAKAVVLARGCRERSRGALNICGTRPAGVYSAGTAQKLINCDGYMVGRRAVILGSGDIGLIMARRMTLQGAKVEAVCEIMPYSGGLTRNIVQCLEDYGIPLFLSTTVCEIHGRDRVEGVTVAQVDADRNPIESTKRYIPCDTLLLSCGLIPENELSLGAGVELDKVTGGAVVDQHRQTSREGIFACGNVLQVHDLVDHVSDEAEIAGAFAADYVLGRRASGRYATAKAGSGVRYVLPQRVALSGEQVSLYLRVREPAQKVDLVVRSGGRVIKTFPRIKIAPGEMERLDLPMSLIDADELTVSVEVQ